MIAEVYPLKRFPRSMKFFDYLIPDDIEVVRGSFVRITIRNTELWGIIRKVKDKPPRGIKLKPIISVLSQVKLREEELSFFESLAKDLAQSVSSLLFHSLPLPPKRPRTGTSQPLSWLPLTLPASEAELAVRIVRKFTDRGRSFIQSPDIRRSVAVILGYMQKHPDQKVLILAPTVRDVGLIRGRLSGHQPIVITGAETNNERFRAWTRFRSSDSGVMVGTRTAILSIDSSITTVFVLRSGDRNHKQNDRNPRFDGRDVVWRFQELFHVNVFLMDFSPVPSTISQFHETEQLTWGSRPTTRVLNIHQEQMSSKFGVISYSAHEQIKATLGRRERVLCIYNKKGSARQLRCGDCAHRFVCPTCSTSLTGFSHTLECARCRHKEPFPMRCTSCKGSNILEIGSGNQKVVKELKGLFPENSVEVVDKEHPDENHSDILVVTSYYYEAVHEPFRKSQFGFVVHLDADSPLYDSQPTAVEDLMRDVWQWAWFAYTQRAVYFVQTASPDLVESIIDDPYQVAKEELKARVSYQLPPVYRWCRITYRESEKRKAEIAVQQLKNTLGEVEGTVFNSISFDKQGHSQLEVGIPVKDYDKIRTIFTGLSDQYIIDTHLFT
jgi:primosomal protein N'